MRWKWAAQRSWLGVALLCVVAAGGCEKQTPEETIQLLKAQKVNILPFTTLADWTYDGSPDGLMLVLQPTDNFGDPNKAVGDYLVELYAYRPADSDHRGPRVGFWNVAVDSKEKQKEYWDPTIRAYRFQLAWTHPIAVGQKYIVNVIYNSPFGDRLFAAQNIQIKAAPGTKKPAFISTW